MTYQIMNRNEQVTIGFNWAHALNDGVTITDSDWSSVPAGLDFSGDLIDGQETIVTVSDTGSPDVSVRGDYDIYNIIETSDGQRLKEKALTIRIHGASS